MSLIRLTVGFSEMRTDSSKRRPEQSENSKRLIDQRLVSLILDLDLGKTAATPTYGVCLNTVCS
jgi:hypothetical protein